jgi:hypothetical protein
MVDRKYLVKNSVFYSRIVLKVLCLGFINAGFSGIVSNISRIVLFLLTINRGNGINRVGKVFRRDFA